MRRGSEGEFVLAMLGGEPWSADWAKAEALQEEPFQTEKKALHWQDLEEGNACSVCYQEISCVIIAGASRGRHVRGSD